MDNSFFDATSQFFQSLLQLEDTAIFSILIVLIIIIVILKILSKISKIIQYALIIGIAVLILAWFLK